MGTLFTEVAGAAITDIAGLLVEEESANLWIWSDDITQPGGGAGNLTKTDYKTYTLNAADSYNDSAVSSSAVSGEDYTATLTIQPDSTCTEVIGFRLLAGSDFVTTILDMTTVTEPTKVELNLPLTGSSSSVIFSLDNRNAVTGANATTGTVIITGKQLERKPYATSLIPTSGAVATRLSDSATVPWPG